MNRKIGELIKEIAEKQGYSQSSFGNLISRTKQGVASIYKRDTIDVRLLCLICDKLDYDFFQHIYETEAMIRFKKEETNNWKKQIEEVENVLILKEEILKEREKLIETQSKLISYLENK